MRAFLAFSKKELTESWRTYRLIVLAAVFILLGIMSPLAAKLLPELLNSMDFGEGAVLAMPEPTAIYSWMQFFGNVGQMGMLALIITFCGIMAHELSRGTLINLLTKGMQRYMVIFSKFLVASVIWTCCYALCLGVCYGYTEYFWPEAILNSPLLAFASLWLFGEFLIALMIFGGVLFGSFYGSLLSCFGVIITLSLLNLVPTIGKYNPISLAGDTFSLLNAQKVAADFIPAVLICAGAVVLLLLASVAIFNKRQV